MKLAQKTALRMQNILKQDKEKLSKPLLSLIKSDIYGVINNYFVINIDDITLNYAVDLDGFYHFDIGLKAKNIKKVNYLV